MEQQNSNTQNSPSHPQAHTAQGNGHNSSNNTQGQQRNNNGQNMRPQQQARPNQDRKPGQDNRNPNRDRSRPNDRNQGTDRGQVASNDRNRGQKDSRYPQKPRDQKAPERSKENSPAPRTQQNYNMSSGHGTNPHPNRPMKPNAHHGEPLARQIKPKRIETVEDIQADIERVEKDIQLEIKQIRAIKLGL